MAKQNSQALNHPISLGIIPTVSPYFLPLILPKIQKEFPNLTLRIEELQSQFLVKKLKEGELDMAILALPYDLKGLISLKFWEEDFYLVYPNNYNHFSNYFKNTYQHGGVSMEEIIIPFVVLNPK